MQEMTLKRTNKVVNKTFKGVDFQSLAECMMTGM